MKHIPEFFSKLIILIAIIISFSFDAIAGNVYQVINLNDDGSGSIKLSYSAGNKILRENKFILGNFAFSEKLARENYTSPNTNVKVAKLDFNIQDSTYYITVELDFKEFSKLNTAKGFSYIKSYWYGTDSGAVFEYVITPGSGSAKFFDALSYIVNFGSTVKSANGVIKDKTVTWGSRTSKNTDFGKDVDFIATTTAKITAKKETSAPNTASTNAPGKETAAGQDKGKSCGLFGFELPLILVAGYAFSVVSRRSRK